MNIYVPGKGPLGAKIMVVGESPSFDEEITLKPFTGPSGREFDKLCRDSGLNRSDCWITNVSKYMVPANGKGKKIPFHIRAKQVGIDLDEQISELRNEINQINPNVILALGGSALWALTGKNGIEKFRGSILHGMGHKVIGTYHPAHLLYMGGEIQGFWQRQVMVFDFNRVLKQSTFPEINRPVRSLAVAQNSAQLYDFIQRHKGFTRPAIDIEARGSCMPVCIGIAYTKHEGLTVPLWNDIGSESISNIPDNDLVNCWILLAKLLAESDVRGSNFNYDRDKIKRLGFIVRSLYSDTMLKAFAINPELPKNLAFNTSIYTEEPYYKDEGMYQGSITDLLLGCSRDSCVTVEVDDSMDPDLDELGLRPFYNNFLMKLSPLYGEIENEGFKTDFDKRDELLAKYIAWDERLRLEMWQQTGQYVNVNSYKQVHILLQEILGISGIEGTGEEVLTKLLNRPKITDKQRKVIENILERRRVTKTIGTYIMARLDYDGRMKTSYFLCLKTGRTGTNLLEEPIRPIFEYKEEGKKKKKSVGIAFQTMTKHGDIGEDIRSQYVADEGEVFIQLDSGQAEARVVFLLADDEQALEDIDKHDYHALTASWFFGGREEDYSKRILGYESPIRFAGKTLRHAGHLGAGKRRAATELNTQARKYKIPISITEQKADQALKIFHAKQPKIQQVFHAGIIKVLEKKKLLTAPLPYGIDAPCGGKRIFFERWNDELFREAFSYIPQRAVSDNTKAAALRIKCRASWIRILLESHDALLLSVPITRLNEAITIGREEMERPLNFSNCSIQRRDLIIPCEPETGYNYKELSKFKEVLIAST